MMYMLMVSKNDANEKREERKKAKRSKAPAIKMMNSAPKAFESRAKLKRGRREILSNLHNC
jgi:hypothetical protein